MQRFVVKNVTDLKPVAEQLAQRIIYQPVVAFEGQMGAGKTTFIKALCECLGVKDEVTSPTFSIINEYKDNTGKVFHFDFYRMKSEREAVDVGVIDYFESGWPCFVEWPDIVDKYLPDETLRVSITTLDSGARSIVF